MKFALVGNPNSGKTTLFNVLTGSTAHVGNWPGVTVDKREGVYKKGQKPMSLIDLPGIYSLSPYTSEEVITRNYILDEKPEGIINIVDATNLERNLYLTTQLLEIDIPVIVALNMIDEVERSGAKIDAPRLEAALGVPVVQISALKREGIAELMERAAAAGGKGRRGKTVLEDSALTHLINDVRIALEGGGVENALFHAVKLIELDELETKMHPNLLKMIDEFKATFSDDTFGGDFEAVIADSRYKYISKNFSTTLSKPNEIKATTRSDKIDKILTNKWAGLPLFLLILFAVFHLTFGEDLFYLGALGILPEWLTLFKGGFFEGVIADGGQIFSPGVMVFNVVEKLTGGGAELARAALSGAELWAQGLVVDGVLGGLFAILSFLPQILLLFLFFSILEDTGYMARAAFIIDRIFRRFGLSGRAFIPMIMGFGCSVPAILSTRTLADDNEKTATIRVIPFFSCGAKLPILTAIAGGIVMQFGIGSAEIITYSMYLLGIVVAFASVILMRSTTMKGEVPPFIMELPNYRTPQFSCLMRHLWDKAKHFIQKAFTVILASTIVIWFISHISWNWSFLTDIEVEKSILASLGSFFQPLFTPLGFGLQLGKTGWVFVVAAVTGLIAKENVIATFGTLAAALTAGFVADEEGVRSVVEMISATGITVPALLAFIAFNMTTIPCFAAVASARAELTKSKFRWTIVFWIAASFIVSSAIYLIGSFWWTAFIFVAAIFLAILVIAATNKRDKKT